MVTNKGREWGVGGGEGTGFQKIQFIALEHMNLLDFKSIAFKCIFTN